MIARRHFLSVLVAGTAMPAVTLAGPQTSKTPKKAPSADCLDAELCAERQAQVGLPRSSDPLWSLLRQCKVSENRKTGLYAITPTPEVKALAGKTVRTKGFTLPLDGNDRTNHFLIGVNTPVCFYHPPGQPNEVIEVSTLRAIEWTDRITMVEGTFTLINNAEMGVFFRLTNAKLVKT